MPTVLSGLPGFVFRVTELLEVAAVGFGLARFAHLTSVMDDLEKLSTPRFKDSTMSRILSSFGSQFERVHAKSLRRGMIIELR
jgi:hypothetical protein